MVCLVKSTAGLIDNASYKGDVGKTIALCLVIAIWCNL